MGGFGSSRWKNHLKRVCVEECQRERANFCPVCSRSVIWVYEVPKALQWSRSVVGLGPACRVCLKLVYRSNQSWGTRYAELVKSPEAREALDAEVQRYAASYSDTFGPPPAGLRPRALSRWFRDREAKRKAFVELLALQNSLPLIVEPGRKPAASAVPNWFEDDFLPILRSALKRDRETASGR